MTIRKITKTVSLTLETIQKIENIADEERTSFSRVVEQELVELILDKMVGGE
jgi:hypothetical protein